MALRRFVTSRHIGGAARGGEFHVQPPLNRGVARAKLHEQFGQALGPEAGKVFRVERGLGG